MLKIQNLLLLALPLALAACGSDSARKAKDQARVVPAEEQGLTPEMAEVAASYNFAVQARLEIPASYNFDGAMADINFFDGDWLSFHKGKDYIVPKKFRVEIPKGKDGQPDPNKTLQINQAVFPTMVTVPAMEVFRAVAKASKIGEVQYVLNVRDHDGLFTTEACRIVAHMSLTELPYVENKAVITHKGKRGTCFLTVSRDAKGEQQREDEVVVFEAAEKARAAKVALNLAQAEDDAAKKAYADEHKRNKKSKLLKGMTERKQRAAKALTQARLASQKTSGALLDEISKWEKRKKK